MAKKKQENELEVLAGHVADECRKVEKMGGKKGEKGKTYWGVAEFEEVGSQGKKLTEVLKPFALQYAKGSDGKVDWERWNGMFDPILEAAGVVRKTQKAGKNPRTGQPNYRSFYYLKGSSHIPTGTMSLEAARQALANW